MHTWPNVKVGPVQKAGTGETEGAVKALTDTSQGSKVHTQPSLVFVFADLTFAFIGCYGTN